MIEAKNVVKTFGETTVLKGVDAVFKPGNVNMIIGQSGSGKTVFMKSLLGLHQIDGGEILYDGRNVTDLSKQERKDLRKEIGMVFQFGALFDSLTVIQNVLFPLEMFSNLPAKEMLERAEFCLQRVNLPDSNHRYPAEISGGMKKRVAIARAIAMSPKYLFCDEPNSGLDPETSIVIDNLISEITQEFNITTVINTHDMNSVLEAGDHIILLKNGTKSWEGSKDEILYADSEAVQEFVFKSALFKRVKKALMTRE
ncbi:MAG: ATP-binding cassette domain-containing protein [Schleiferiaceae bacterium]|nr:ATP-binding cassette domain-containing protein [Schleiferiaceae bacterium]